MLHALIFGIVATLVTPPPPPPSLAPIATPTPAPNEPMPDETPTASPSPSPSPTPSGPRLTLSVPELDMNPAQQRTVLVSGGSPPLTATLDAKIVTAVPNADATGVVVTATQQTGTDVLHLVDANGARADLPIRVAFNAGTIVPTASLKVTGSPADGAWLVRQVQSLVARLTQAMPLAQTTIGDAVPPVPTPLPVGAQMQFSVPVKISSDGRYFDQDASTIVNVENVPADPFVPSLLFYDDDPEHVAADGVLFRGTIDAIDPVRLYYYHDNAGDPRRIVVVLSTASQNPASVQTVDAAAGPNADVMSVGHAVTRNFLLQKPRNEGVILDLTADQPYVLRDAAMNARDGVAGNVDFKVLSGGPVTVTVLALSPGVDPRTLLDAAALPDDGHHRNGVFRLTGFGSDQLTYAAGGPDVDLAIGDREPTVPAASPSPGASPADPAGHDYGDYGVWHDVAVTLNNPGPAPATAYLYFKPLVGIARASFLVDGNLVEIGCVRLPQPYQIQAVQLPAQGSVKVALQTMTDGGSFYPVEVGVTATPPAPAAPPITAPDGCFPKPGQ